MVINAKQNPILIKCQGAEVLPLDLILEFQGGLKKLSESNRTKLMNSICTEGFIAPLFVWDDAGDYKLLDGHQRLSTLIYMREKGWDIPLLPVVHVSAENETDARRKLLKITSQYGEFDMTELQSWINDLGDDIEDSIRLVDEEIELALKDGTGEASEEIGSLSEKFLVPPFSILDTRQGYWQERKRIWKDLIKDKAESREEAVAFNQTIKRGDELVEVDGNGVSLLDPVLAEVVVKWFGLPGGNSFDCFAGDSVFGYVASSEGQKFTGIELRQEQAGLNSERIKDFKQSKYICDDGQNVLKHIKENSQDLLFSCPPYYDLEVYSDLENDASNQGTYEEFLIIIENAFNGAVKALKNDRFAVIVVGDIRDHKKGAYRCYPDDIKKIFNNAGLILYNELILIEMIGTAMLRAGRYMNTRKVAKVHQNVLVFYKGDTKKIKENFPVIEVPEDESTDI